LKLFRLVKREAVKTKDLKWLVHMVNVGQNSRFKDSIKIFNVKSKAFEMELGMCNIKITKRLPYYPTKENRAN
jgi:hypothetical protein